MFNLGTVGFQKHAQLYNFNHCRTRKSFFRPCREAKLCRKRDRLEIVIDMPRIGRSAQATMRSGLSHKEHPPPIPQTILREHGYLKFGRRIEPSFTRILRHS